MIANAHAEPLRASPRLCYVEPLSIGRLSGLNDVRESQHWDSVCARAKELGFNGILSAPWWRAATTHSGLPGDLDAPDPRLDDATSLLDCFVRMSSLCARHQLALLIDLPLAAVMSAAGHAQSDDRSIDAWITRLAQWAEGGIAGFRCIVPQHIEPDDWRRLIQSVKTSRPHCTFLAWTPGLTPEDLAKLAGCGFDYTFSSLPWWDYRHPWLVEEHERLAIVAPVIAPAGLPSVEEATPSEAPEIQRAIQTAAALGDGMLIPMDWVRDTIEPIVARANLGLEHRRGSHGRLHFLQGAHGFCSAILRREVRDDAAAHLVVINPDTAEPVRVDWDALRSRFPDGYARIRALDPASALPSMLKPAQCYQATVVSVPQIIDLSYTPDQQHKRVAAAMRLPRIAIENISPVIENGRYPAKAVLGELVRIEADIFMDGHDKIAAALLWRASDETQWRRVDMALYDNDRWRASFHPERLGQHVFAVEAWWDEWATYRNDLQKKHKAGLDVSLEAEEGRLLIAHAIERTPAATSPAIHSALIDGLERAGHRPKDDVSPAPTDPTESAIPAAQEAHIKALLSDELALAMAAADAKNFLSRTDQSFPINVERQAARFASWYELFPRSQGPDADTHGTFDDVARRLPDIQRMGFDVLYFPPIHPIGQANRKGRNNSLKAGPGDPGSPYAIGASEGGHDAIHPELGSLADFRRLIERAHQYDIEIALDFAIQCSPDHPWLAQHPGWFDWRADGSLRYAENPPKRYEDIVNVDFYGSPGARQAPLWVALRDVILFWVAQGVKIFRVDNPHTKPLPFWEWMIADVQRRHPDTIFLSEAFTRPKMMYRLAKVGFSQSYTYFTWRNDKQELTDYLTELNALPASALFRPHFFVNTPDINPYFLQASGRPGFLIRAALATTMSGLWGMYNGFELCEAQAVPGKEEYLDSEKYEIRDWDMDRPGNIIAEITQLNRIRRSNPALHSHLGLQFHPSTNEEVIFYSKATPQRDNVVLVAISLNPHATLQSTLELPLWQFGLPDTGALYAEDLFNGHRFTWHGKHQQVVLRPQQPFAIWRAASHR